MNYDSPKGRSLRDFLISDTGTCGIMQYAIWNNKGGVGKSFLTFIIGSEFALKHSKTRVVIMDLCPQANVSEMVLGGNGVGAKRLASLLEATPRRTIGGYFDERISSPQKSTGKEASYLLSNKEIRNGNLPVNLYLVAGDPSLEIQAQAINQISAQTLPTDSWRNVHSWLTDLIDGIKAEIGDDTVFFIDCNPSFAAYTELAVLAAERLIVPCTADGSSARAIDNIGRLVYGKNVPTIYQTVNFSERAQKNGFKLPPIHIVFLNRSTQWDKKASKAFRAMLEEIKRRTEKLEKQGVQFSSDPGQRFIDVPDAHTVSVVCSHEGISLSNLKMGPHRIDEETVQVNPDPLDRYKLSINKVIDLL